MKINNQYSYNTNTNKNYSASCECPKGSIFDIQDIIKQNNVSIGELHSISNWSKYKPNNWAKYLYNRYCSPVYQAEDNKGINNQNARKSDVCLAKYSKAVADEMTTTGSCYTGVKHALWNAGVIKDYSDMPKGSAHNAIKYFDSKPEQFQKVDVEQSKLKDLEAGHIVVYTKDGKDGHIAITNGNGQEMSDCTDNMKWLEKEGKSANYAVYRLTDNWQYDDKTNKLNFVN